MTPLPHVSAAAGALGPSPYLVALDVDGTVMAFGQDATYRMRAAIDRLVSAGSYPVIATGRGLQGTLEAVRALRLEHGWAVCSNGAMSLELDPRFPGNYRIADVITFDPQPVLTALRDRIPQAYFSVEDNLGTHRVNAPFPPGSMFGDPPVVPFAELCATAATRVCVYQPDGSRDDFRVLSQLSHLQQVSYSVGWTAWMDLTPPGVSKASGLELIRARMEVDPASTVAVGDGDNDVDMLRWARLGVVMGHGTSAALDAADAVTETCEDDGAAVVIDALLARS